MHIIKRDCPKGCAKGFLSFEVHQREHNGRPTYLDFELAFKGCVCPLTLELIEQAGRAACEEVAAGIGEGECSECLCDETRVEPCAKCRRTIHESWHASGLWWIRREECHAECPGRATHPMPA
ncbi:MAG TPA: hypothetical protein VF297_05330 [Pyrinomonadaceae bacterium]